MNPKPYSLEAIKESASLPDLTAPTTLEALLAMHPTSVPRVEPTVEVAQPSLADTWDSSALLANAPTAPKESEAAVLELDASLLFINTNTSEAALARAWVQRMCGNSQVGMVAFHDNVVERIQRHQPQAVLIQFDPSNVETATQLVTQLQISNPHLPRVAIGHVRHTQCMLAALRSGVQDFLDVDGPMQTAKETLRTLIERIPAVPVGNASAPLTAILSARAGMGCSLLASHLAWYLQEALHSGHKETNDEALDALLIDLGNPNGDCSLYLNTSSDFTFLDAVNNLRRFDRRMASTGLARHESGLRNLILPRQSGLLREVSYADADALIQRLRQYFRHVIADLGAVTSTQLAMRVALQASQIWVVCDQSIASVVSTSELLQKLQELQIDRQRLQLIVSRNDTQLSLSAQQISQQLNLPLLAAIPDHRKVLAQTVNQGQLLASQLRRDPYVQALNKLNQKLLNQHHAELIAGQPAAPQGLMKFLLQFLNRTARN